MPRTRKPVFSVSLSLVWVVLFCAAAGAQTIKSPGGKLSLTFALGAEGEPTYQLSHGARPVIKQSRLGVELRDAPGFLKGFSVAKALLSSSPAPHCQSHALIVVISARCTTRI